MSDSRWSRTELRCTLLWRLARRHAWGNWVSEDDLTDGVPSHEEGQAREIAEELRNEPFVLYYRDRGYKINHDYIDTIAFELRDTCGYSEFRIEETLSHFAGF